MLHQQSALFPTAVETVYGEALEHPGSKALCSLEQGVRIQARDSKLCSKGENKQIALKNLMGMKFPFPQVCEETIATYKQGRKTTGKASRAAYSWKPPSQWAFIFVLFLFPQTHQHAAITHNTRSTDMSNSNPSVKHLHIVTSAT